MPHIHVLLAAPLRTGDMAQPGAGQHKGRIVVRESPYHTSAAADLPVEPFNDIVGADVHPAFIGKITAGQWPELLPG